MPVDYTSTLLGFVFDGVQELFLRLVKMFLMDILR